MRWTTAAVIGAWAAALAFAVLCPLLLPSAPPATFAAAIVVATCPLLLGTAIARRVPGHPASVLLAAAGPALLVNVLAPTLASGPLAGEWMLLYLPHALVLLVVPDGRTAGRRWTVAGWTIGSVVTGFLLINGVQWAAPGATAFLAPVTWMLVFGFFALLVVCAAAPIARYRHSGAGERVRLRWVFVSGLSLPLTLLLCWADYLVLGNLDLVIVGIIAIYLLIPLGVTIALVRPALFDVDRAAVATVTGAALTVIVLGALSIASGIVGVALAAWSPPVALAAAAIAAVAAVLGYRPLHRVFDRLLYPERGRAIAALHQLSARVDAGADRPASVQEALRAALRDPFLIVGFRSLTDSSLHTLDGRPVTRSDTSAPVRVRGEEIGVIAPSSAHATRPASAIARAAAPLVDAARLGMELDHALAEATASRARLLRAGDEERRRLERDLHDGAQQRLVALGMRLRVLQRSAADQRVSSSLDAAVAELSTAVAELRQIAQGARPSALDDGLGAALAGLTRLAPTMIELDVHAGDLADPVLTTAYFVANEAVANALRHSGATRIRVQVHRDAATVRIGVADDGCGGAHLSPTGGLTGLADRVAAIGGHLAVDSPPGAGTRVEAVLPCGS
jgi:signal transduction histidine kinase